MDNDYNKPNAIAVLFEFMTEKNKQKLNKEDVKLIFKFLNKIDTVLSSINTQLVKLSKHKT